jgi:predicted RNA-binding Zn ribbon-like protein
MEPGGRQPAPGDLALVQRFINTLDIEASTDELSSPEGLSQWLAAHELIAADAHVDADDLNRARGLRESLRVLLDANHGAAPSHEAIDAFNEQAARLPLHVRADPPGRLALEPAAGGVDGALGRLLAIAYTAAIDGTWSRLKVCPADTCRWAFYDHSKNRSSTWCSMAVCGNRAKVRAYQQRRRASR